MKEFDLYNELIKEIVGHFTNLNLVLASPITCAICQSWKLKKDSMR
ncbi:MAG TPA: hypothetical protein VJB90_02930 [Candidatus Nanoarchaeia archaeon]|nr:hypothetical protein [Candidatus Nanoarchaeia archaeon]